MGLELKLPGPFLGDPKIPSSILEEKLVAKGPWNIKGPSSITTMWLLLLPFCPQDLLTLRS